MLGNILTKVFGSKNDRELKKMQPLVGAINVLEPEMQQLDDTALAAKNAWLKVKPLTICFPRPLPWSGRHRFVSWACGLTTSSSSVVLSSTGGELPR